MLTASSQSLGIQETRMLLKTAPERRLTPTRLLLVALLATLYIASVIGYCAGLRYLPDNKAFLIIERPLPLLLLVAMVFVYAERNRKTIMYTSFVVAGLMCCFVADIIFASSRNPESVVGISLALLAKACYTVAFTLGVGKGAPLRLLLCVPFYAFCGAIIALVYDKIKISFVLFVIDEFVTSTMGWRALALTSGFPGSDRAKLLLWLSVVGAALWMGSDTLLVINAYYRPIPGTVYLAPAIYYLAQLANSFSVPRRLTRSDYWLDHFTFLIEQKTEMSGDENLLSILLLARLIFPVHSSSPIFSNLLQSSPMHSFPLTTLCATNPESIAEVLFISASKYWHVHVL